MKKGDLRFPDRDFLNRKEKLQEELIQLEQELDVCKRNVLAGYEAYQADVEIRERIIEKTKSQLAEMKEEEPKQSAEEIKFAELSENLFNLAALDNGWLECSLSPQDCITLLDWFKVNVLTKYRQQGMPTEEEAGKANSELLQKRLFREEDINPVSYSLGFKDCAKWALNKWKGDK